MNAKKNNNTTALRASLECNIPAMKNAAARTIRRAIAKHETKTAAAASLGISYRTLLYLEAFL